VGTDFDTGPIEVGRSHEVGTHKPYPGPFDQARFAEAATTYFRELPGSEGWALKLRPRSAKIRMQGNRFVSKKVVEFDAPRGRRGNALEACPRRASSESRRARPLGDLPWAWSALQPSAAEGTDRSCTRPRPELACRPSRADRS